MSTRQLKIFLAVILLIGSYSSVKANENGNGQLPAYSIDDKEFLYDGDKYPNRKNVITHEELQHSAIHRTSPSPAAKMSLG